MRETSEKIYVLTRLEKKILAFLGDYLRKNDGESPTLAEIGDACGISSVGTVHRYVSSIESKGLLERSRDGWRTRLAPSELPFLGRIVAGTPFEAIAQAESVDLAAMLIQPDCFVLEVHGHSMIDAGILEGDLAVIRRAETANEGEIVVALVDESDATLKEIRFDRSSGAVRLIPHNKEMSEMHYQPEQVKIQGVLSGIVRKF